MMGSRNTGKFTDYPGTSNGSSKSGRGSGNGSGDGRGGGAADKDQCLRVINNVSLEEVSKAEYFLTHKAFPPVDTAVSVRSNLVGGRIGVETLSEKELIGLLPTDYNYLLQCMKQDYKYSGAILSVKSQPIPVIRVELVPQK